MQGIILCGGAGKRMWPYNRYWQKCCLPVGNVPVLLRLVGQLRQNGVGPITLVVGHNSAQVRHLARHEDGLAIVEADERALGGCLAALAEDGQACLCYGDVWLDDKDVAAFLNGAGAENRVLVKELAGDAPQDHICAQVDGGRVRGFWGHPRGSYANARVVGLFVLQPPVLRGASCAPDTFLQVPVGGMPPLGFFLEQCLQTALEDGHPMAAFYLQGPCARLVHPWDILAANTLYCRHVVGGLAQSRIDDTARIAESARLEGHLVLGAGSVIGENVLVRGNCVIGAGTAIENGAVIGANCVIGSHTAVRDYCKIGDNTVIGSHNKVGFSAEVAGVTLDGACMVHGCEVYGVVGRSTDIAAGCTMAILRFDDGPTAVKAPVKPCRGPYTNGVFLGDHCRTGVGNLFAPGVRVGANSALGPGLLVDRDIPENKLVLVKQQTVEADWGPERYGW